MPEVRLVDGPDGPALENGRGRRAGRPPGGGVSPGGGGGGPVRALDVTLYEEQPFVALRSHLTNAAGTPLAVQAFHVVRTAPVASGGSWRFYRPGAPARGPPPPVATREPGRTRRASFGEGND